MEANQLSEIILSIIHALECARNQYKLVGEILNLPSQRENVSKVRHDVIVENKKSKFLLKQSYGHRSDIVVSNDPGDAFKLTIEPISFLSYLQVIEK